MPKRPRLLDDDAEPPPDAAAAAAAAPSQAGGAPSRQRARPRAAATSSSSSAAPATHRWNEHREAGAGARFRAGRWTPAEDEALLERYDEYCALHSLEGPARLAPVLGRVQATALQDVWTFLADGFDARTIRGVMRRAKRLLHPGNRQGGLDDDEQALLLRLVERRGPRWDVIGRLMNRLPASLATQHGRLAAGAPGGAPPRSGPWAAEEEAALAALVARHGTPAPGAGGGFTGVPWVVVASELRTRTPGQCLLKWRGGGGFGLRALGLTWDAPADAALVGALLGDGGESSGEVDWGLLLEGRSGPDCRARFSALAKRLPPADAARLGFVGTLAALAADLARAAPERAPPKQRRRRAAAAAEVEEGEGGEAAAAAAGDDAEEEEAVEAAEAPPRKEGKRRKKKKAKLDTDEGASVDALLLATESIEAAEPPAPVKAKKRKHARETVLPSAAAPTRPAVGPASDDDR